ncbi:MAG: MFS transporter [Rhodopila sp.]|nr:MFS transporter [Rhodopila sp.]
MRTRYRWVVVGIIFMGSMLGYLDRTAFGVAAPMIANEFGLSPLQMGFLFSAFFAGYALFGLVGGFAADRFGSHKVIIAAALVWSLFCGLTATAGGFALLLIVRMIFGMGEGPWAPSINKLVSRWFPRDEQASAMGFSLSSQPLGAALAGPVVGLVAVAYGWRVSFIAIALLGICWVAIWALLVCDYPEHSRHVGDKERAYVVEARINVETRDAPSSSTLATILRADVLSVVAAWFGYSYILFFFLSWFPTYMVTARHLDIKSMAILSVWPWTLGFIGHAGSGFLTDALYRWLGDPRLARKIVLCSAMGVAALAVGFSSLVASVGLAVVLLSVMIFCLDLSASTPWALLLDTVEQDKIGRVSGFGLCVASLAGIVAPALTGWIVQATGSFVGAFVLAGAIAFIGASSVAVFVRKRRVAPTIAADHALMPNIQH